MNVDELVDLLKVSLPDSLTPLQELVLRYSWEGKTYASMAEETNYVKEYLGRTASDLWSVLSDYWKEPINKNNLRLLFESRQLTKTQQQFIGQHRSQSTPPLLEFPGAPVSADSPFYVVRPPIEELACEEVTKPGSIICIKAPWKMGKTSLMLKIFSYSELQEYRTVNIDFQQADKSVLANSDKFFRWFSMNVSRQLMLDPQLDDYWDEDMGSKVSCTIYFQGHLLKQMQTPLVLGLNEVNILFEYPDIAEDFLSLLRSWYEQAKVIKIWQKLRLVLAYSTEIYIPLHLNQSPFNVGLPLKLPQFTSEQVSALAQRHQLSWSSTQTKQLMELVGGHPYLLRLAFYYLCRGDLTLKQVLREAPTESGIYSSHLRRLLSVLKFDSVLEQAFQQVIAVEESVKLTSLITYKLDSLGLVNINGDSVTPSCELYRLYFKNQLLQN